jgi:hypothetical protein
MSTITFHPPSAGPVDGSPNLRLYRAAAAATGASAGRVSTWTPEEPLADWMPLELTWSSGAGPSHLTLRRLLGVAGASGRFDRPERCRLSPGDRIILRDVDTDTEWFRGHLAQDRLLIQAGPDSEELTATAMGPELLLAGKVADGQWCKTALADDAELAGELPPASRVAEATWRTDLPVVFNAGGRPNASASAWTLAPSTSDAPGARVFEAPGRRVTDASGATILAAEWWTAATAVRSLVEVIDGYEVISPASDWLAIEAALGTSPLGEVDADGLGLDEALERVLEPLGFAFAVEPWADETGRHRLVVFSASDPLPAPTCRLGDRDRPTTADTAEARRTTVQRIELARDGRHVANDVRVLGEMVRAEVELVFDPSADAPDLHPAWDRSAFDLTALADAAGRIRPMAWTQETAEQFAQRYHRGGSAFAAHRDVYRSFAWNEDAALSAWIATVPDLSDRLGEELAGRAMRRPRPVGPRLARPAAGGRCLPPEVWIGIVGDDAAWTPLAADVWPDRAGLTVAVDELVCLAPGRQRRAFRPFAAADRQAVRDDYGQLSYLQLLHNALDETGDAPRMRLKLVGTIELDQAVGARAGRRIESSWPIERRRVIRAPHRLRRQVRVDGLPDAGDELVDDTATAGQWASAVRDAADRQLAHGSILLRGLSRAWAPGQSFTRTDGRRVSAGTGGEDDNAPVAVRSVVWNFTEGAGKTQLLLETARLKVPR